ncbi:MAG: hypothetical protein ACRBB2_00180 [Nitrosopumilus sp.]
MIVIITTMAVVTALDTIPEAKAFKKSQVVYNPKYGSDTKEIVCGDRLYFDVKSVGSSNTSIVKPNLSSVSMSTGEISVDSVMGAMIKNTEMNEQLGTIVVSLESQDDGNIMLNLPSTINDVFMVIDDGEELDDAHVEGNKIHVHFYAGAEKIEILGNVLS